VAALETLPGVGPKVAACVALMALRKPGVVPVDTHVWQVAQRHYTPRLRGRALSREVMAAVEAAFVARFGERAGWAQTVLFVADLPAVRARAAAAAGEEEEESGREGGELDGEGEGGPLDPVAAARAERAQKRAADGWTSAVATAAAEKRAGSTSPSSEEGGSVARVPTPTKAGEGKRARKTE
jgi:hypothetical protein